MDAPPVRGDHGEISHGRRQTFQTSNCIANWYPARLVRGHHIMTGDILTSVLNSAICHLAVVTVPCIQNQGQLGSTDKAHKQARLVIKQNKTPQNLKALHW